jgi:hypothetical protein
MVEVLVTDEFENWYEGLEERDAEEVTVKVDLLQEKGVALGYPHSSAIKGSRIALRELRVQSAGRPLRVFYAFDPSRNAVLLFGGDKTGNKQFYEQYIARAEKIWCDYLEECKEEHTR